MATLAPPHARKTLAQKRAPSAPTNRIKPLHLALVPIGVLAAFSLVPRVDDNLRVLESVWGAVLILLVLYVVLRRQVSHSGRTLHYEVIANKVHYVQLMMHTSVYIYWGWYWREVYRYVPLILVQIAFIYGLDMLVCWFRRDKWILGFGPFPIILSTNLFLWFRDDWFFLQLLLIATGVLGKEFIKWKREGRVTHIFNPSALSLFLFSVVLIATSSTDMTWGAEIAATIHRPPHIYLEIFLLGLVVQGLFRVTLVTLWSAVALLVLNLAYTRITGDYNFIDSNIPVSVFLGLHLLVTDPVTSPRRALGKILFGAMYGVGVFGMYRFLTSINAPEFYDKLLCVPALNLTVIGLDRVSDFVATKFRTWLPKLRPLPPVFANYAWMTVWVSIFIVMTATGFLAKGHNHPGGDPAFWQKNCEKGDTRACTTWVRILHVMCEDNSTASCLKVASLTNEGRVVPRNALMAGTAYGRACDSGISSACLSLIKFVEADGKDVFSRACNRGNGASCFILGSLYSAGEGVAKDDSAAFEMFRRSCDDGWSRGCGRLGVSFLVGQGTDINQSKALQNFERGCDGRNAASCLEAAKLYRRGGSEIRNEDLARERLAYACELGIQAACRPALPAALSAH